MIVECTVDRADVAAEIDALDKACGGGGAAEAVSISFFRDVDEGVAVSTYPVDSLIGQVVVINYQAPGQEDFAETYIFEAIMRTPAKPGSNVLLNNYLCAPSDFERNVKGRTFPLSGFYYCQQNRRTHACAQASLRMLLNGAPPKQKNLTSEAMNALLGKPDPAAGLKLHEVVRIIEEMGEAQAEVIDGLKSPAEYLPMLASIVESGHRALLGFATHDKSEEHVVTVFGYTRSSDEWHPQAMPVYVGPEDAKYYSSSMWIDHFLIHDDNFGPYFSLGSRTLETKPEVEPRFIVALRSVRPDIQSDFAQTLASIMLKKLLPDLKSENNSKWIAYISKNKWCYVLRTVLIARDRYVGHLVEAAGHDHTRMSEADLSLFDNLPDQFWMVEYSLPALFTGNRSKLGEVLIQCSGDRSNPTSLVLAIRAPSLILLPEEGQFVNHACSLDSHSTIYCPYPHDNQW